MYSGKFKKDFLGILSNILKNISSGDEFKEIIFRVSKEDYKIHAMNQAKCMQMVGVFSYGDIFETYDINKIIEKELIYSMKTDLLSRIINKIKGEDTNFEYLEGKLIFKNNKGKFEIPALEPNEDDKNLQTPNLIYTTEMSVSPALFYNTLESGTVIYNQGKKEDLTYWLIFDGNKFNIETESDYMSSKYNQTFDEEDVVILEEKKEKAKSRYSYKYLEITNLPLDIVEIKYNTDYPIKFQYYFGDNSGIYWIIAPRVSNEK